MYKVLVSGSRSITNKRIVYGYLDALFTLFPEVEVLVGDARGVDALVYSYCKEHSIPVTVYRAKWNFHGIKAGLIRNDEMLRDCDYVICIWDGSSRGTKYVMDRAEKLGRPFTFILVDRDEQTMQSDYE